jgi:uncharacterized paraquat-inducible protein A
MGWSKPVALRELGTSLISTKPALITLAFVFLVEGVELPACRMKKKYNSFSQKWITIDKKKGERVCWECKGLGKSENNSQKCGTCGGKGKLDWIDRILHPQIKGLLMFCRSIKNYFSEKK